MRDKLFLSIYKYNYDEVIFFYKEGLYEYLLNYFDPNDIKVNYGFIHLNICALKKYNILFYDKKCLYKKREFMDFYYNKYEFLIKLNNDFNIKSDKILKIENKDIYNICKNEFKTNIFKENYIKFDFHLLFYILQEIIK